jgi:flagellar motor protein MotB
MNPDDNSTPEAPPDPGNPTLDDMMSGIDAIGDETSTPAPQPASPTPAPTQDPTPAPVATPAPAQTPAGEDDFGLSKLTAKPAAKTAPEPAKPAATKPAPEPVKPAEPSKPADPAKPEAKGGIKELREQYELTKAEREQLAAKVAELERTREEGTRKQVEEATKALKEEIESIRKEREEAEREIQFLDYTKSREYAEKYQKPLTDAWTEALQDIDGIKIAEGDGSERPADERDILALTKLPAGAAAVEAHERFGPSASVMLQHRANIVKLSRASQDAVKQFREEGARVQEERAKIAKENESKIVQAFDGSIAALEESHPALFGKPTEAEDVGLFEQGHKLVEVAFKGRGLENLPPDQRQNAMVKAQANVAARARSYGPQRALNMRLERQVAELQEKLAKLTAAEPGQGSKPAPSSEPGRDDQGRFSGMSASEAMVAGIDSL